MYNYNLDRIAVALEKQNDLYKKFSDANLELFKKSVGLHEAAAERNGMHDDLLNQIVALSERLVHLQNTVEDQNQIILQQKEKIKTLVKEI